MGAPLPTSPETARQARREYIHALVEQSWARPEATRTVARPHIVLMVAALTAAVALGSGVVAQLIHPVSLPRAAAAGPPSPRALAPFVAVAGWDCPQSGDRGFDIAGRSAAWRTVAHGGWAENGCHGTFEAIPISADRSSDGTEQGAVWWFAPPAGLTRCEVAVFRPRPDHPADSAATTAQFYVLSGRSGARMAAFTLNLSTDPGSWVPAGTFPVAQNGIAVQLVDRGAPAKATARLAISQVKVRCTS